LLQKTKKNPDTLDQDWCENLELNKNLLESSTPYESSWKEAMKSGIVKDKEPTKPVDYYRGREIDEIRGLDMFAIVTYAIMSICILGLAAIFIF
jgi:hypothetical protein